MQFLQRHPKPSGLPETAQFAKTAGAEWKALSAEEKKVPVLFL
jgi:hypothetical protein